MIPFDGDTWDFIRGMLYLAVAISWVVMMPQMANGQFSRRTLLLSLALFFVVQGVSIFLTHGGQATAGLNVRDTLVTPLLFVVFMAQWWAMIRSTGTHKAR